MPGKPMSREDTHSFFDGDGCHYIDEQEIHPSVHGNGVQTADFFKEQFGMTARQFLVRSFDSLDRGRFLKTLTRRQNFSFIIFGYFKILITDRQGEQCSADWSAQLRSVPCGQLNVQVLVDEGPDQVLKQSGGIKTRHADDADNGAYFLELVLILRR